MKKTANTRTDNTVRKIDLDPETLTEASEAGGSGLSGNKALVKEILDWVKTIALGVIVGVLLVVFVIQKDNVQGDSMKPTLLNGNAVFIEKVSTYFHNYKRGDIVVLDGHDMEGYNHEECLIKRIVGLPGETVRIADHKVYIKEKGSDEFKVLDEPYLASDVNTDMMQTGLSKGYNEVTLGDNEYYCLGDNRPVSNDSRNLGPFTADRIEGVAFIVVYPFSDFKFI